MKQEKEYCCTGFKRLGLVPGEEVKILEGIRTELPPAKVTVAKEYPAWVQLDMEFVKSLYSPGLPPRHILTGVHKGAMLCGDVKLKRMSDGIILCGSEVGTYAWV